jgi:PAS domain S-box-containing protein
MRMIGRIRQWLDTPQPPGDDRLRRYTAAVLVAAVAVLIRAVLEPLLAGNHTFVLSLTAVVFVAWYAGAGPAMLSLALSIAGIMFLFIEPRHTFALGGLDDQVVLGLFVVTGLACALLGEAQRRTRRTAERRLADRQQAEEALRSANEELERQAETARAQLAREQAAHAARQQSENQFRVMTETVPGILFIAGPDGGWEYMNRRWADFTGRPVEDSAGAGWIETVHPDDRPQVSANWSAAVRGRKRWMSRHRFRAFDGSYRWFLARANPVPGPDGQVIQWIGVITDIEESVRAEAELRGREERYRFLAETLPALVWSSRADGTPDYHNSRWFEYTGLPRDVGQDPTAEVVHPDDRPRTLERWQRALETGTRYQNEYRLRRADGAYRWFLAQSLPMRGEDGAVARWFGTAVDIDDQKRQTELLEQRVAERTAELLQEVEERRKAEEQVQATAAELARSNEELEKFAYVASHDLQEPLRKIQAFGDRLRARHRDGLGEQGRDYLARILNSAGRMRRLIEDLLALSRVTTKGQPFAPVDLAAVAQDVLSDLEERIEEVGGSVAVGPLPTVDGDGTQMRQLLQNLIGNALKFRRTEVPPAVAVRSEVIPATDGVADRPFYRITVADNGIGFDEKYLDRIFQVFQRLHGRQEYEGTGVGLAICRKIVERHGGTITARSTPGEGATFVVTLPTRHPDGQP